MCQGFLSFGTPLFTAPSTTESTGDLSRPHILPPPSSCIVLSRRFHRLKRASRHGISPSTLNLYIAKSHDTNLNAAPALVESALKDITSTTETFCEIHWFQNVGSTDTRHVKRREGSQQQYFARPFQTTGAVATPIAFRRCTQPRHVLWLGHCQNGPSRSSRRQHRRNALANR